jgi:phosphoglycolate phosphatase
VTPPVAPVKAVIFDLDGTLADSLAEIGNAMNAALQRFGFEAHPLEAYKHMVGEGVEALVAKATRGAPAETAAQVLECYRDEYRSNGHQLSHPYPGVLDLLQKLQARQIPMSVLSNKRDEFTKHLVSLRFLGMPFVDVRGERPSVARKPDPTAALELATAMRMAPSDVTFVGDTAVDMRTARNAGMVAVGVTWGFRGAAELREAGASRLIDRPAQLLDP